VKQSKVAKFVYSLFLGGLLALFVGVGVGTFYPVSDYTDYPEYPQELNSVEGEYTEKQKKIEEKYNKTVEEYDQKVKDQSRNTALIVLAAAVILVVVSAVIEKRADVLGDGLMFGGLFLLGYAGLLGLFSGDSALMFGAISAAVLVTLALGYVKFVRAPKPAKKAKKKK